VELTLKKISKSGIAEAISKAQLYRYLNEPEETESICKDILDVDPDNQMALRTLGLAITDQFGGQASDRYAEAEQIFGRLTDLYERHYYMGIFHERRAKAQMRAGRPPQALVEQFKEAMRHFEQAEKIRPPENDDAVLRWNRCVRLLEALPKLEWRQEATFDDQDIAPVQVIGRKTAS
jgi:tetratricopeptide (TPR) repeat protein